MTDFLDQTRTDIDKRLKELRPLHEEFLKLEQAKAALQGIESPRRGPGRPRGSRSARSSNGRRRRRRGGTRAEQALRAVRQSPGITVAELSDKLRIRHKNYLYRVLAGLQSEGAVRKEGKGYVAT
jgi:hypothetical protein